MMSNEEIITYWIEKEEPIIRFPVSSVSKFDFQEATLSFLSIVGLPADSAPFLSFNQSSEKFQSPSSYFKLADSSLEHFVMIGVDGAGSPLVIDTSAQDQVLLLDHENGFTSLPVNRSLKEFQACLVIYNQFIDELLAFRGPDAFLDADFTDAQFAALKHNLLTIDRQAVEQNGFWHNELDNLLVNREQYKAEGNS